MEKEKMRLADFVQDDRFELNTYLTYLFKEIQDYVPHYKEDQTISQ